MITAAGAVARRSRRGCCATRRKSIPLALQLGGSEPARLARAARARRAGGLRRDQSQLRLPERSRAAGAFGACLMARAGAGRRLRGGDARGGGVPVTVKMRIGVIGERASRPMRERLAALRRAGLRAPGGVHARGQRRRLRRLHRARAQGGARRPVAEGEPRGAAAAAARSCGAWRRNSRTCAGAERRRAHARRRPTRRSSWCDGVMLGREAYHRPYLLGRAAPALLARRLAAAADRAALLERMARYAERGTAPRRAAGGDHAPHARPVCRASPARATTGSCCPRARARPARAPELLRIAGAPAAIRH